MNLQRLQEIFKRKSKEELERTLRAHGMVGAVDVLIGAIQEELRAPIGVYSAQEKVCIKKCGNASFL